MSSWKKIRFGMVIFTIFPLMAIIFLLGTTSGIHLLFSAASLWVPGLKIDRIVGSWHNLNLINIRYQRPGVVFSASELHLAIKLSCLHNRTLCVNDLSMQNVNLSIDSKKIPISAPVEVNNSLQLNLTPYLIMLNRIAVKNVNVKIDDTTVSIIEFKSGLRWQKKNLTLTSTLLYGLLVTLPKATDVTNIVEQKISESKRQKVKMQRKMLSKMLKDFFSKPFLLEMTDVDLPINLNIEEFRGTKLYLVSDSIDLKIFNMLMKISNIEGNMNLETLEVNTNQGSVSAKGNVLLHNDWPVDINISSILNIASLKGEKIKIKVGGALQYKLDLSVNLSGPIDMALCGQILPAEDGIPLNLKIVSNLIAWPLSGNKQFQANNVRLKLAGKITDYIASFHAVMKGQEIKPVVINFTAKGNERQINFNKIVITALEGKTELTALIAWQQAISWRSNLKLININTAKLFPGWPFKLNGLIKVDGSIYHDKWLVDIPEIKLDGNIRHHKVKINGSLEGSSYLQWVIHDLHLVLGRNMADIKGELGGVKNIMLDFFIDAPNLDNTLPGLGGTAKGRIKICGAVETPQILADITASRLRWQDFSIDRMQIEGDIKSSNLIRGKLDLFIEHITHSKINVSLARVIVKGNEKLHDLYLRVHSNPVFGLLYITGNFDRQAALWKGQFKNIRFSTPAGIMTLLRTVAPNSSNTEQKLNVGPHCVTNNLNAELCISRITNAGTKKLAIIVNVNRFNLAIFKTFISRTIQANGIFSSTFYLEWDTIKKSILQGSVIFSGHSVKLTTQIMNETPLSTAFDTLSFNACLDSNHMQLVWLIRLTNDNLFEGQVQVNDPKGCRNLSGTINVRNFNLAMMHAAYFHGEKITGLLNANLQLAGTVNSPLLFGLLLFNQVNMDGSFMPFDMLPSKLTVFFHGMTSTLTGVVRTSHGQINLSGKANWNLFDNWRSCIITRGTRVRITVLPMIQLEVSPNMIFETTPNLLTIKGKVDVPLASIVIHSMPESVASISKDEVLLNENLKPIKLTRSGIAINSNLIIHMGNNVQLDAFGLKAMLVGDLKVTQDKYGLRINGQINIPEGHFHSYGLDLIVRKGTLLFSGPPDQPVLNIEAILNPDVTEDNVIAGLRINGPVDEPRVEIFSEPVMSLQEVLSYLLHGLRLNNDRSDSSAITSMLVGLGIAKGGQVIGKIGETFGVRNLELDTKGVGDSSQVVFSGYILPGLLVKYGVGIFDSLTKLTLRYRLMPKLYLEAVSAVDLTLDLVYQLEF